ncbi:MAG: chain length determinant family protein [Myxococcaceae bacterium]|nr:chain length determinant family protein [Myxococcaceae bacterium]
MTKVPTPLHPDPQRAPEPSDVDLFDYAAIKLWFGFIWRSLGRHRVAGILSGLMVFGMAVFLVWVYPKKYESQSKLLANRNTLMASLGNPHRSNNSDMDGPTRAAQETVMARDNLVAMVKQTKLLEHWEAHRHPVLKLKDQAIQALAGQPNEDQRMDGMVGTLEKRFNVYAGDGTVVIAIYWPDGPMARQLVETAQQNFLETRHVSEVSAISETISILEMHASETQTAIEEAVTNVQKVADERKSQTKKDAKAAVAAIPARPRPLPAANKETPVQELSQLKFLIRTKRRAIADLEEFRARRLTELQAQLAEQKVIYSANHPVVVDSEQRIDALQKESPQIETLKRDELALIEEYKSRGGKDVNAAVEPGSTSFATRNSAPDVDRVISEVAPDLRDDPAVTVARSQLAMATSRYQDILMRIDAARIELDTARAAFKYRYTVVSPAQTPRNPISPNVPLIVIAGVLAGLLFSFLTSTLLDLRKGKVIEAWQVEKKLGLPLLAQVKL